MINNKEYKFSVRVDEKEYNSFIENGISEGRFNGRMHRHYLDPFVEDFCKGKFELDFYKFGKKILHNSLMFNIAVYCK